MHVTAYKMFYISVFKKLYILCVYSFDKDLFINEKCVTQTHIQFSI